MDLNLVTRSIHREHDACGIFAVVLKHGVKSREAVDVGVQALKALRHRAGFVRGEGDGCGLMLDVPRALWRRWLSETGVNPETVDHADFFVTHLFLDRSRAKRSWEDVQAAFRSHGAEILCVRRQQVHQDALGPSAAAENPVFVQIAAKSKDEGLSVLVKLTQGLERLQGVHVASLDRETVVYKVVGDEETLYRYYQDLQEDAYLSSYVLAHTRYSTNTKTSFARVQPFRTLGHNGEINTIARFYEESGMVGIPVDPTGSDSQMVAGAVEHFTHSFGWSLYETAELFFPPIIHEIKQLPQDLADMYMHMRALWGPFAQGPAGVMLRAGNEAVFSVDALGLRPMWWLETADMHVFSSEQGIVPADEWIADPKPLSPGEKIGVTWEEAGTVVVHEYRTLQQLVLKRMSKRYDFHGQRRAIRSPGPYLQQETAASYHDSKPWKIRAAAFGWREDDIKLLEAHMQFAAEPIKSLGHDEPLAALSDSIRSISDFIQETVAVVTNPAIDREREIEHFSTRVLLGKRPSMEEAKKTGIRVELPSPLLLEANVPTPEVEKQDIQAVAHRFGNMCYEDVLAALHDGPYGTVEVLIHRKPSESVEQCLDRVRREVIEAVQAGANVVVLDDRLQFIRGRFIDPLLTLAAVHKGLLRPASSRGGEHLRRRTSLILRSGGLRNLHDIMVALGLGADAVNPYMLWESACDRAGVHGAENVYTALCKGVEKVLSTLGIHELRGYERLFSSIGLSEQIASILGIPNFCATASVGYGFAEMENDAAERQRLYDVTDEKQLGRTRSFQIYPRLWKSAGQVADGSVPYDAFFERLHAIEQENPVSLRHALRLNTSAIVEPVRQDELVNVDTSIHEHAYPFLISSMSFGSQGETAYRAYAEAAYRLNILAMNGEGGEIKDLLTTYPKNRGRQVASGRFGVNAELCNGAYVLEIKIGQGAKPGEGGHLPGSKVTVQVANARNASPGIDLISPSNNHDIYSIEDLAQVIQELRTVNPFAKIAVKVPVVPNIGTIAVGIVKAGADIVELSGFDGGTGAARAHAIRHVGLPADLGIKLVHDALCEAGLRDVAEIWADGGMKSGMDVIKAILLGANRVGFGSMAMVAIGCTACRACHKDTCHVGIATQMTSYEEAYEKGLKQFAPQDFDTAVERLVRWFTAVGEHVRVLTASLGATRTQDLVGRCDLLQPFAKQNQVDLTWLTRRKDLTGLGTHIRYRDFEVEDGIQFVSSSVALAAGTEASMAPSYGSATNHGFSSTKGYVQGDDRIQAVPRVLGTWESGDRVRRRKGTDKNTEVLWPRPVGNGFAAYQVTGLHNVVYGGAQDGVGKSAYGGRTIILKHRTPDGRWMGGSVGKGLAYGAQRGLFIVQGNADARAGIRLSGADIVIGGELQQPVQDELGFIGTRANIAGFAFEYMTSGRALVLGDPGPWMCSGMTGGSVYVKLTPELGFTETALRKRIAKGAKVSIRPLDAEGEADVIGLLSAYQKELRKSGQREAAKRLTALLARPADHFVMIRPGKDLMDQSIATE